jgi:non-ribosomal peptide synthetase component F
MEALWRDRCATNSRDAPALVFEDGPALSCCEVDVRVSALAAALRAAGAGGGVAAAMFVAAPDDEWEVVAMLACLSVQAPWCPADEERLDAVCAVARPACVLVRLATFAKRREMLLRKLRGVRNVVLLPDGDGAVRVLDVGQLRGDVGELDGDGASVGDGPHGDSTVTVWGEDALYILCTSGTSQGVPRAVVGSERATAARLEWGRKTLGPVKVALRRTPALFVDSIAEVFGAVLGGGALYVARAATLRDFSRLVPQLGRAGVTHLTLTPSILQALLRFVGDAGGGLALAAPDLQTVVCSGEPLPLALRDAFALSAPRVKLCNVWGCTECAADGAFAAVDQFDCKECRYTWKRVPIGNALEGAIPPSSRLRPTR